MEGPKQQERDAKERNEWIQLRLPRLNLITAPYIHLTIQPKIDRSTSEQVKETSGENGDLQSVEDGADGGVVKEMAENYNSVNTVDSIDVNIGSRLKMEDTALGGEHEKQSTPLGSVNAEHDYTSPTVDDATNLNAEPETTANKRQKSIAWSHFTKMTVNGKRKHNVMLNQPDIRQKLLASNLKSELSTYVYNEKDGRDALAKMVILHEYPLSIVDHIGFKNFTKTIQHLFKCPCRNTLKRNIMDVYNMEKCKVIQKIEKMQSRIAITTDMWTSSNQKKRFYGYHRFVYVPCPHTSEVLTDVLMDALMEIKDFCVDLVKEYQDKSLESSNEGVDYMGSGSTNEVSCDENLSSWEKHFKAKNRVPSSLLKTELDRYLEEGIKPESQDFDILMWWKLRATKYPILQAIAKDILANPVSTVASESAFSASGRLRKVQNLPQIIMQLFSMITILMMKIEGPTPIVGCFIVDFF
ncbi:hypothetical protein LXL04_009194 [Taraxacum kok-saghyz]